MSFKDHFSTDTENYNAFRPSYPEELFDYLASLCPAHDLAWDCATGTGQAARSLASRFRQVVATDASAPQIEAATAHPGIGFEVATAESSGLKSGSADLITVAQAIHWFDLPAFQKEAARVLKGKGIVAVWTYTLLSVNDDIDRLLTHLYTDILGGYWPPERKLVDGRYTGISLPFEELDSPAFEMNNSWALNELLGYLNTWSAVKAYTKAHDRNPLVLIEKELAAAWSDPNTPHTISWPLALKAWRKPSAKEIGV